MMDLGSALRVWLGMEAMASQLNNLNSRMIAMTKEFDELKAAIDGFKAEVSADLASLMKQVTDLTTQASAFATTNPDAAAMSALAADVQASTEALHAKFLPPAVSPENSPAVNGTTAPADEAPASIPATPEASDASPAAG